MRVKKNDVRFKKIQERYGLEKPEQIKMRILFSNVMGILKVMTENNQANRKLLSQFNVEWQICEQHET